jgi:ankyrin repeat protein
MQENSDSDTPLHIACHDHQVAVVEKLLELDAPLDSRNSSLFTPLASASFYGSAEIVQMLLDKEVDVDVIDTDGMEQYCLFLLY